MTMSKVKHKAARDRRIAAGLCGFCGKPRESLDFLCDACAAKHRQRQRDKKAARIALPAQESVAQP
jgi:predicted amidophosphoribosyltransferase